MTTTYEGINICITYLPIRARTKTKYKSFNEKTLEQIKSKISEFKRNIKHITRVTMQHVKITDYGDGLISIGLQFPCDSYRYLTQEEINELLGE